MPDVFDPGQTGGPLAGIRVLELANIIAGPMAGRYLAELGADVIKLESPDGDVFRQQGVPEFHPLNSGKRGICLDLKTAYGRAAGVRLAQQADVLLNNMRPGVAERLELGWADLCPRNPRLVYCQITAFGVRGPYAARPGGDPLAGALTGMQAAQGGYRDRPVYVRGAPIDYTAALLACAGILMALVARQRSGRGQMVDTSLLDAGALINCHAMTRYAGRPARDDLPPSQYGFHSLYRLYETASGWLYLAIEQEDQWRGLCEVLDQQPLVSDARFADAASRIQHDAELVEIIQQQLRLRTAVEWANNLSARKIPSAVASDLPERAVLADDQVLANGWVAALDHPDIGPVSIAHRWLSFSRAQVGCTRPAPRLGEHTAEVLAEIGYSERDIADLTARASGVTT